MSLPALVTWQQIHLQLPVIFPPGAKNREHSVWEISAKTIFVLLYVGAVEGTGRWLRPDQVTRMTDKQAALTDEASRVAWAAASVGPKAHVRRRWYADNTRESIRDDTIRNSLIPNGAVIEREGITVTSPLPRYALQADFAALFAPDPENAFETKAAAWREKHLSAGARARIALVRQGAVNKNENVFVTFPNKETRSLSPGPSAEISKAVIEEFAPRFLIDPGVIFLSESKVKVVARDDELAKSIGLNIPSEKSLPDIILVDLGPAHPLLVFVEVVWSDGPVTDERKDALLKIAQEAGFSPQNVAFLTAFHDRGSSPFRKAVGSLAWGSYAWFMSEPDKLLALQDKSAKIGKT